MFKQFLQFLMPTNLYILDEPPQDGGGGPPKEDPPKEDPKNDPSFDVEYPEGIDESLKGHPTFKPFVQDGKFNYANVLKSLVHAQKLVGKDKVVVPGKDASPEEWDTFYNRIGRPEADKYDINLGEDVEINEEFMKKYKQEAHKNGILPKQAKEMLKWYYDEVESVQRNALKEAEDTYEAQLHQLKKDWGYGYDKEVDLSRRALREFATEEEITKFKESGLTSNVEFIRLMNKIGKTLKEDTFKFESKGHFGMTKQEAQDKINNMFSDREGPYLNQTHTGHKKAVEDMLKLQEIISG